MTLSARLVSESSKAACFRVRIAGVPCDFTTAIDEAAPTNPSEVDGRGTIVRIQESASRLDMQKRMQIGGGFTFVVQDRDGVLDALFAVRSFRATHVSSFVDRGDTTINVGSTSSLAAAGIVYIGGETIAYSGKTSTTITVTARNAYQSPEQVHRGGSLNGASVFTVPPSWLGRRVRVTIAFRDDAGDIDETTRESIGVFRVEAAPISLGNGRWEIRCSHLSDELARRKLGSGLAEIKTPGSLCTVEDAGGLGRVLSITTVRGVAERMLQGTIPTHAIVQFAGASSVRGVFRVFDVEAETTEYTDKIRLYATPLSSSGDVIGITDLIARLAQVAAPGGELGAAAQNDLERIGRLEVESIKHIAILDGATPGTLMRYALESRNGDGTTGAYDVLPGVEPTVLGGAGFRFGAGLTDDEIDTASFDDASLPSGWSWPIDEEVPLADLIRDFCRDSNTAAIYSLTGDLTASPLVEQRTSSTATIAEAHLRGPVEVTIAENSIYGRVRVECNYDPIDGEYEGSIDVIDEDIAATYAPAEGALVVRSRSLVVEPVDFSGAGSLFRSTTQLDEVLPSLRRTMTSSRGGQLIIKIRTDARHLTLPLGALVALTLPSVTDMRGSVLDDARGRIIEREPDWQTMTVGLTLVVEETLWHFAPFGVVDSVLAPVSGIQQITLTSDPYATAGADAFRPLDECQIITAATGARVGAGVRVTSITSSAVLNVENLSGGSPSLPLVAGQIIVYAYSATTAPSTSGAFTRTDYAHMDGLNLSVSSLTRWR